MSLDTLTNSSSSSDSGASSTGTAASVRSRRSLTWLLPIALLAGFLCVLALLFGKRLIPAVKVKTAPVITLRLSSEDVDAGDNPSEATGSTLAKTAKTKGSMIFQASGWVEPDPYTTYVPTLINGIIDKVHVLEGQSVKKGELLATLVDDDAKLNLQEAQQKIARMNARIEAHCAGSDITNAELTAAKRKIESLKAGESEAVDNLRRLKTLPAGAVSVQQVVKARLALEQQQARVAEAEAEIPRIRARLEQIELERVTMTLSVRELETIRDRAQLALDRTRITAPMDGIIIHLHAAPGKKRMLDMDDPKSAVIVELYDPKKLQARIDVPLNEAAGIQLGQVVELVSDILPNVTFHGQVTRISGEADLQRNTLQAKVAIRNPDQRLRPEMLVRAKFFSIGNESGSSSTLTPSPGSAHTDRLALYVPEKAIIDEHSVWVVTPDQTAERRTIQLGVDSRENHRRVLEGLKSGEQVILPPHQDIKNGTRVNPNPETRASN